MTSSTFAGKLDETAPLHVQFAIFLNKLTHATQQIPPFVPVVGIRAVAPDTIWMMNLQEDQ